MRTLIVVLMTANILIALVAVGSLGYFLGARHMSSSSAPSGMSNGGNNNNNSSTAMPISADPFNYDFSFIKNTTTSFIPIIYLAPGFATQVYVLYSCDGDCGGGGLNLTIGFLDISSYWPIVLQLEQNGTSSRIAGNGVNFTSYSIVNESSSAETIAYTLSTSPGGSGYYSFIFPFTCSLQPVLYVGTHARNLDDSLIGSWVSMTKGVSQPCAGFDIDVTLIGFTNALYNRISLEYPSSSSSS